MMQSVKHPSWSLSVVLLLFMALTSSCVAQAAEFEPLPVSARARLGRGTVATVQYSPDGTRLAVGGGVGIWLYDAHSHEVLLFTGHTGPVRSAAFSPDGETLASGGDDGTVRLWDARTDTLQHTLEGHTGPVWSVAFSPDGETLASGSWDGTVLLWNLGQFEVSAQPKPGSVLPALPGAAQE